jgi:glycosyltransferase involved in cell wall biosynthesis
LGEASAFGLPSMTTNVGGLASTVVDGVNGYTFPLESFVESAVSEILRLSADREAYNALSLSSFNRYETDLNWDVFSDRLIDIFSQSVGTATSN